MNTPTQSEAIKMLRDALSTAYDHLEIDRMYISHRNDAEKIDHALQVTANINDEIYSDDIAVDLFAVAMKEKMAVSRDKGRSGWDDAEQCSIEDLQKMMLQHLEKGDPVDVGNFAMMLFNRKAKTTATIADEPAQPIPEFGFADIHESWNVIRFNGWLHRISAKKSFAEFFEATAQVIGEAAIDAQKVRDDALISSENDLVLVPRDLLGAASHLVSKHAPGSKTLALLRAVTLAPLSPPTPLAGQAVGSSKDAEDTQLLQFLEDETMIGHAPNLVFDDDGHWAVSYTGMQPMPEGDGKGYSETVGIHCIVQPDEWKSSVREAIRAAMSAKGGEG